MMAKRILQIPNYLYPHIGGIEQVARDIANALKDENYEQKIICFNEDAQDENYVCHRKETAHDVVDGIEVVRCGCFTKVASQSLSLTYSKELKNVMNQFRPNIVIFHYPNPFVSTLLMKYLKRNFKFVVYWHLDITKQKNLGKIFNKQSIKLLQRADKVIATSPNYIDGSPFLKQFKEKIQVIPCCIDPQKLTITKEIQKKSNEIRKRNKDKIICFAFGRHVPYKGITYLIQASKLLDDRFKIYIGGKGPLTDSLVDEAKGDKKIEFLGRISDEDLVAYLNVCDIFCFPSITKNEAFGIALAEGMYFGKPAVTFNIPGSGVNYVSLNGVTGIECENGNVKEYAKAIKVLSDNNQLRNSYGIAANKRVIGLFMNSSFYISINKLIEDIWEN